LLTAVKRAFRNRHFYVGYGYFRVTKVQCDKMRQRRFPGKSRENYSARSMGAGFWPSTVKVPTSPSTTVAATAASAAAAAGPGSQANGRFITWVITRAPARDPAATPNRAVALPISRYSSA